MRRGAIARTWPALVIMLAVFGTLAWLSTSGTAAVSWIVLAARAILVASLLVRVLHARRRRRNLQRAVAPAVDAAEAVQNLYLGREDLGAVAYGVDDPEVPTVVTDVRNPFEQELDRADRDHR